MFYNSFEVTQRSVTRSRCWQIDLLAQQTPPFLANFNMLEFLGCPCRIRGLAGHACAQMSLDIGITGMLLTWLRQNNQMTSDKLKLLDLCFIFLDFSNLYANVTPTKTKILSCGNDAHCLGVLAGFSRNLHFYKKHNMRIIPPLMRKRTSISWNLWSFFTIFECIEYGRKTLKCSESFVLTEPQDIVIFWIFLELQVQAKMT